MKRVEWLPQRPKRRWFSTTLAVVCLVVLFAWTTGLWSGLTVRELLFSATAFFPALWYVWYSNHGLRYRISEEAVELRKERGWRVYPRDEVAGVRFIAAFNVESSSHGMAHRLLEVDPLGQVLFCGYTEADEAVFFKLRQGEDLLLTPEEPHDFLAHLLAFGYAVEAKPVELTGKE